LAGLAAYALYHILFVLWDGADAGSDGEHHQLNATTKKGKDI
jgi:hypothetical protein